MSLTITAVESIDEVDVTAWESLRRFESDLFMDRRFIRAVERTMSAATRFWHLIVRDEQGMPVAAASCCLFKAQIALLADSSTRKYAEFAHRWIPGGLTLPIMMCGLPVSAGQSHLRLHPDADAEAVFRELHQWLLTMGKKFRARAVVFKEADADEDQLWSPLQGLGYRRADSLPMNQTPVGPKDFQEFMTLTKSSRRYQLKKARQKFEQQGLKVTQLLGKDGANALLTDEVHRLYLHVLGRSEVRLEQLTPEFFRELSQEFGEHTCFTFISDADRVLGFACSAFDGVHYHQMFVGYDPDKNPEADVYFNLFFQAVDHAFRQQPRVIAVGQSADEFKYQKLNCYQVPRYFYVFGIDWISKLVLKHFFLALFPKRPLRTDKQPAAATEKVPVSV